MRASRFLALLVALTAGLIMAGAMSAAADVHPVGRVHITSRYGMRVHPITHRYSFHDGVDYAAPCGKPIRAAEAGRVRSSSWDQAYGLVTYIRHSDRTTTFYGHQSSSRVHAGQRVKAGQVIGRVGSTGLSTGCHLHFGAEDKRGRPMNPLCWLRQHRHARTHIVHLPKHHVRHQAKPQGRHGNYRVRRGDSLSAIAPRYGMTWQQLCRLNHLHDCSRIRVGQHLSVRSTSHPVRHAKPKHRVHSGSLSHWLKGLRMCESGGNYRIATGNGYYGAYQFALATWRSLPQRFSHYARADLAPPRVQDQAIVFNTRHARGGLASQNPGCYQRLGLSQFPPSS